MLGVDEASVANEIAAMEQENVICGYHTLIDWDKAGLEKVTAMIEVRVTPQRGMGFDKIAERIYNYPEVKSVYLISGGFDLMVTLEGKTLREVSQFVTDKLSTLDQVLSTKTKLYSEEITRIMELSWRHLSNPMKGELCHNEGPFIQYNKDYPAIGHP